MLFSLALMFICSFALSGMLEKINIPGLLGMLLTGVILGPFCLNLIAPEILNISADLREIALIVILTRVGLALGIEDLKKVGRPAILMCFIPATCEIAAVSFLAPVFFGISHIEAMIMGAVLAAVSPAVVVPKMLMLMENGYGKKKGIPQLIMAGASVDDIYAIILFTSFIGMYHGNGFNSISLIKVPVSILSGLLIGIIAGFFLVRAFQKIHVSDTVKILLLFSAAFLFISLENIIKPFVPMSGLLAVMAMGAMILKCNDALAKRLSHKYSKIWVVVEMLLFVLVGASVSVEHSASVGFLAVLLIISALVLRILGVFICLLKTPLNSKERFFCAVSYLPKATVQAAIGGIALSSGVAAGNIILTVAVLAIMITAPLGAIGTEASYKKLLRKE